MWRLPVKKFIIGNAPFETVFARPFHQWYLADGVVWAKFFRIESDYLVCFPGLADFIISADGLEVIGYRALGTTEETMEHLYAGQVLLLAFSLRGNLVFHASAVDTARGALAFMGVSGRGKSTLAASFSQSGFRLLTDDGLLLEKTDSTYLVQPSHPCIRLWDDSREALVHKDAAIAPPVQFTAKTRILSDGELVFRDQAQPLHCVYFLGNHIASEISIERIKPSEALIGLVNHSFLLDIEAPTVLAEHFDELTAMVSSLVCYRLDYPRRYEDLPRVLEAILRHSTEVESIPA